MHFEHITCLTHQSHSHFMVCKIIIMCFNKSLENTIVHTFLRKQQQQLHSISEHGPYK